MWFLVVLQCWKHWDSEYSKVFTVPVYAVDKHKALEIAQEYGFELGYGAVAWHEVLECGRTEPKVVLSD